MSECAVLMKWKRHGKSTVLRDKPVPLSLCPPQNPCEMASDQNRLSTVRSQWLDRLSHCTVCNQCHKIQTYLVQNRQLSLSSHTGTSSSTTSTVFFLKLWNHILKFTTTAVTCHLIMTTWREYKRFKHLHAAHYKPLYFRFSESSLLYSYYWHNYTITSFLL